MSAVRQELRDAQTGRSDTQTGGSLTIAPEDRTSADQLGWAGWAQHTAESDGVRLCQSVIVDFPDTSVRADPGRPSSTSTSTVGTAPTFPGAIEGYRGSPSWVVEGLADVGRVGGIARGDRTHPRAQQFLDARIGRVFGSSYDAVGFYWQLNHLDGGPDALWSRIPNIIANSANRDRRTERRPPASPEASSPGWDRPVPGNRDVGRSSGSFDDPAASATATRPIQRRSVRATAYEFVRPAEQVAVEFDFTDGDDETEVDRARPRGADDLGLVPATRFDVRRRSRSRRRGASTRSVSARTVSRSPDAHTDSGERRQNRRRPHRWGYRAGLGRSSAWRAWTMRAERARRCQPRADRDLDRRPGSRGRCLRSGLSADRHLGHRRVGRAVADACFRTRRPSFAIDEVRLGLSDPIRRRGDHPRRRHARLAGGGAASWSSPNSRTSRSRCHSRDQRRFRFTFTSADLPPLDPEAAKTTMDYVRTGSSLSMSNIVGSLANASRWIARRPRVPACMDTGRRRTRQRVTSAVTCSIEP